MRSSPLWLAALFVGCLPESGPPLADLSEPWRPPLRDIGDWELRTLEAPLACPDGEPSHAVLVRPREPGPDLGIALVIADGAFDYVPAPDLVAPLDRPHFHDPPRLRNNWALRRAYAFLGEWPMSASLPDHQGALAIALAERDLATLVVPACWGDLGSNDGDNAPLDGFLRQGAAAALWAWSTTEPETAQRTIGFVPTARILVALGDSGRGASAILQAQVEPPDALLLDSVIDDLSPYYNDRGRHAELILGLDRIWPAGAGAAAASAIANSPLPESTFFVYSSQDPVAPSTSFTRLSQAIDLAGGSRLDAGRTQHLQTSGDLYLARTAVRRLLDGPDLQTEADEADGTGSADD
ncbi:MAG: hypothetical protein EA397_03405 [Deltaproteobacteria bacterium]|nr:MAG: hypothetical protein EA397_03405 [Deltaproteobacteria bacterium]